MKRQLLGLIALIVFLGSMVQTTQAKELPPFTNPFEFHKGIPREQPHSPISGVCGGLTPSQAQFTWCLTL